MQGIKKTGRKPLEYVIAPDFLEQVIAETGRRRDSI